MHNNYYFLKHLSASLDNKIRGFELLECFSQNKNELVLGLGHGTSEFYIKAYLAPSFCCLFFPDDFSRARKNSVDLFKGLYKKKVERVHQFKNERCFSIVFEDNMQLLFKMHGNRSNIVLFKGDEIEEVFKKNLRKDFELNIKELDREINQSYEAFKREDGDLKKLFPTFGKIIKAYLKENGIDSKNTEESWPLVQHILERLAKNDFYITESEGQLNLSLLKFGNILEHYNDPLVAINAFYIRYISETTLNTLKREALSEIHKQLKQGESYIEKTTKKLQDIEKQQGYNLLADVLMANLHRVPAKAKEVTLENFYDNNLPVTIRLKQDLSPQKNAEVYYRKAKNQSLETEALKKNLARKEASLDALRKRKGMIEEADDFRSLKNLLKKDQPEASTKDKALKPYHSFNYGGFDIWVGKNAKSNDRMLQQYAHKEDLWLHAKDVSGSHVLIKYKAGKNFPKDVIEKAASLAGWYSKRKSDSLCPVIVTPRKFVRKRKGDPPGAVVVDKEMEVLLAVPERD
ncbi:Fibronectin/fibrinogen-binding protein [Fulvivirga imtechensis AK7]|uniref:Fibronectin/fibrinogen-binding protein n=1 Tax=Fulvivirga imtechensis AK7 TaxID=1237149 RepID=L8JXI2_9BACT|nr:NFACT RNA binding domain-containing protein [Fulvivirga imtechensis]ELR72334.1 Fibronectin/fibrinogen-binding protein [Fulvivirga imtechensis AK7]